MGVFDARQSLQMGISPFSDDGHTQAPLQYCLELRSSDRLARGRDHPEEGVYPPVGADVDDRTHLVVHLVPRTHAQHCQHQKGYGDLNTNALTMFTIN